MRPVRLRSGDFAGRLERAEALVAAFPAPAAPAEPLGLLRRVVAWQGERADDATVTAAAALLASGAEERRSAGRYPLLAARTEGHVVAAEVRRAVRALGAGVPVPLARAGAGLQALPDASLEDLVTVWLDDESLVDATLDFWVSLAAAPVLEQAAAMVEPPARHLWMAASCPLCGGRAQVSVIMEESGEFMAGSPRSLVCGRCVAPWPFPRARCVACGEQDTSRLHAARAESWPHVRVDACDTCRSYVKTFDLRQPGGADVVPTVDDVATLVLDVWAAKQGLSRPARSLVGV